MKERKRVPFETPCSILLAVDAKKCFKYIVI